MKQLVIPLSLSILAVATLGACSSNRPADTFPRASIAAQPVAYTPGPGTITKISASPSYTSAAVGGTAVGGTSPASPSSTVRAGYPLNRLVIRMDSGATQYIDTDSNDFRTGMRIEVLPDHTIRPL